MEKLSLVPRVFQGKIAIKDKDQFKKVNIKDLPATNTHGEPFKIVKPIPGLDQTAQSRWISCGGIFRRSRPYCARHG